MCGVNNLHNGCVSKKICVSVCVSVCVWHMSSKVSLPVDNRIAWDLDHSLLFGLLLVTVDAKFRLVFI